MHGQESMTCGGDVFSRQRSYATGECVIDSGAQCVDSSGIAHVSALDISLMPPHECAGHIEALNTGHDRFCVWFDDWFWTPVY